MATRRPDLQEQQFQDALHEMYGDRLPPKIGEHGWLDMHDYDQHGILMASKVIAHAERVLVHSLYAAQLARLDARSGDAHKLAVVPYGFPDPGQFVRPADTDEDAPVIGTFGLVAPVKQPSKLVEAFAIVAKRYPSATLAIVGPAVAADEPDRMSALASRLGITDRIRITGDLAPEEFRAWLARTTVAVQLRAASNGETSAAIADCYAAGIPTVATALGSTRELPADTYIPVTPDVSSPALAETICALIDDHARRRALSHASREHARNSSFRRVAEALLEELLRPSAAQHPATVAPMLSPR
jgi:glycosyltransferase involved in cell wall biosynthesis